MERFGCSNEGWPFPSIRLSSRPWRKDKGGVSRLPLSTQGLGKGFTRFP
jgi:hypothetical protein